MASRKLAEKLRRSIRGGDVEVVLVTDKPFHEFQPLFFDIAFGNALPEDARAPIVALERYGVRVFVDSIERIDLGERLVRGRSREYRYDYLIISLGVEYGWDAYPGLNGNGYHNYTLEAAIELNNALSRFKKGRIVLLVPEIPHRCMMYPHEAVTMLAETYRMRGLGVEVALVTPEKGPLIGLSPEYPKVWLSLYEELGVEHVVHKGLEEVDGAKRVVRAGNVEEKYDLLIKVPPSRPPRPLVASEGFLSKQDSRWTEVRGPTFRHPSYDEVFLPGEHSMPRAGLPTAGIPVHFASEYAADVVLSDIVGLPVPGMTRVMTCVGYYGARRGFAGNCETRYVAEEGRWRVSCYTISTSPFVRLLKEAFYRSWIAQLK